MTERTGQARTVRGQGADRPDDQTRLLIVGRHDCPGQTGVAAFSTRTGIVAFGLRGLGGEVGVALGVIRFCVDTLLLLHRQRDARVGALVVALRDLAVDEHRGHRAAGDALLIHQHAITGVAGRPGDARTDLPLVARDVGIVGQVGARRRGRGPERVDRLSCGVNVTPGLRGAQSGDVQAQPVLLVLDRSRGSAHGCGKSGCNDQGKNGWRFFDVHS